MDWFDFIICSLIVILIPIIYLKIFKLYRDVLNYKNSKLEILWYPIINVCFFLIRMLEDAFLLWYPKTCSYPLKECFEILKHSQIFADLMIFGYNRLVKNLYKQIIFKPKINSAGAEINLTEIDESRND